jgi:adenylosuccinate synthase
VDFGTYPYVTSSNTISAAVCTGLGVAPSRIGEVIGVTKAYCTRVGAGPFPTELFDKTGEELARVGNEFGAVTGRPRRCGWIDLVALRYTCMINGASQLVMTKADVLDHFETIKACTAYRIGGELCRQVPFSLEDDSLEPFYETFAGWEDSCAGVTSFDQLPAAMKDYLHFIEQYLKVPVKYISTGPARHEIAVQP